jgi:hypothetical protein
MSLRAFAHRTILAAESEHKRRVAEAAGVVVVGEQAQNRRRQQ